jgi:hypothetical protein
VQPIFEEPGFCLRLHSNNALLLTHIVCYCIHTKLMYSRIHKRILYDYNHINIMCYYIHTHINCNRGRHGRHEDSSPVQSHNVFVIMHSHQDCLLLRPWKTRETQRFVLRLHSHQDCLLLNSHNISLLSQLWEKRETQETREAQTKTFNPRFNVLSYLHGKTPMCKHPLGTRSPQYYIHTYCFRCCVHTRMVYDCNHTSSSYYCDHTRILYYCQARIG